MPWGGDPGAPLFASAGRRKPTSIEGFLLGERHAAIASTGGKSLATRFRLVGEVISIIRIVARPGQEDHTLRALRAVSDSATALPGCLSGTILREVDPPRAFVYAE